MRRQKLHFDNLDQVLKSSKSTRSKGTQQFETPAAHAEVLCLPLPHVRTVILDPQCGHGALLRAAAMTARYDTRALLGIDIDPTASIPNFPSKLHIDRDVLVADFTKVLPMLLRVKARFDLIVSNPPFSLRWEMEPFNWRQVNGRIERTPASSPQPPVTLDSTLATFESVHALLTKQGEGMMICNGATADRLLVPHPLYSRTWLRLNVPNFFPGVAKHMQIAVLYFAASHKGDAPLVIDAPDSMPDTITRLLEFPAKNRDKLITGDVVRHVRDSFGSSHSAYSAVAGEWKRTTDAAAGVMGGWNIRLSAHGTISTYLTPFQTLSGDVPMPLVESLGKIDGQHPTALVVQRASRKALVLATKGSIWRVHPDVVAAVDKAMREYNAVRAPLRPLNRVQRLGHLDEEDAIKCERSLGLGFRVGVSYELQSETIEGRKLEPRSHFRRPNDEEIVLVRGQELLLRIKDDFGKWHAFTQYSLGAEQEQERPEDHFHLLSDLVECFEIPEVPDVAQVHAGQFEIYRQRLIALQC